MNGQDLHRNYAITLATAIKKWFWGPLCLGKTSQVSALEADSFKRLHDSIIFHKFVNPPAGQSVFSKILADLPISE